MVEDVEGGFISPEKLPSDYPMKIVWKKVFIRLFLVGGILWMLLILTASLLHVWSCRSSITFFSGICKENFASLVFFSLLFVIKKGFHDLRLNGNNGKGTSCSIPLMDEADKVVIPKGRTPDEIFK
ncbi:hypothetical protein IC582_019562 [Cucumis melo]